VVTLPVARDQRLAWPRGDAAAPSSEFTPVAVASHPSGWSGYGRRHSCLRDLRRAAESSRMTRVLSVARSPRRQQWRWLRWGMWNVTISPPLTN